MVCSFSESWSIYYIFFIHHYTYPYLGFTRILRLPPRKWISCISIFEFQSIVELHQSLKNKYSSGIALYYNSEKHLMNNFQKDQSNHCYLKWKSPERLLWGNNNVILLFIFQRVLLVTNAVMRPAAR